MSTRSVIARRVGEFVEAIYCHFDGYPEGVGKTLDDHYQTQESRDELFALGDISELGTDPISTIAYGRDRGEEGTEADRYINLQGLCNMAHNRYGAAYIYYHDGHAWSFAPAAFTSYGAFSGKFSPLSGGNRVDHVRRVEGEGE